MRRSIWWMGVVFMSMTAGATALTEARALEQVTVDIAVVDESGAPVPYASVWSFHDPCTNAKDRRSLCLNSADLSALAHRLRDSFEFVQFGLRPLPMLLVPRGGDSKGVFGEQLRSDSLASESSANGAVRIGYIFLKRGYQPALVEFEAKEVHSKFSATVVLKRDPAQPRSSAPYVEAFERLRYELSDAAANAEMTPANQARLQRIRAGLERVVQQALAAGDKPAAARAYGRLAWMPALTVVDGRIVGFDQAKFDQDALSRAAALDPENPFLHGALMNDRAQAIDKRLRPEQMNPRERAAYDEFVQENVAWIERSGVQIWPRDRLLVWRDLANLGHWERAYQWIRAAQAAEPKYEDYERVVRDLTSQMRLHGVPIPAHWK